MKNLVVTAAGLSSRFEGLKPKWMLTHPKGNWMIVEALKNLDFDNIDKVYFGFLQEHIEKYNCKDAIDMCLNELGISDKAEVVLLDERTDNQPHTVYEVIKKANIQGQIIIKEVDNRFEYDVEDGNFMCYYDLNKTTSINPSNKSYITIGEDGYISDLVEKKVISSTFGCGSYSFENSEDYCEYFEKMSNKTKLFLSDIIKQMVEDGLKFKPVLVSDYIDWGTKEDWFDYVRQYKTLFVDIDGTLVKSSGKYTPPFWGETDGIKENIDFLNKLYDTGKVYVILTTARPSSAKDVTIKQLEREGVKYDNIIFDLFHANRTLINDYGTSNPYPTCDAVNIVRNSNELERFLKDLGK
tara:strand:+ start:204 stop:1265 length:1062 start_codon:yes stop_codon:yes gene_type:complete